MTYSLCFLHVTYLPGFLHVLEEVKKENNMGHALCRNLCDGWWQAEYTVNRLKNKNINLGNFPTLSTIVFNLFSLLKSEIDMTEMAFLVKLKGQLNTETSMISI